MKEQQLVSGSTAMSAYAYRDVLEKASQLSLVEQLKLIEEIAAGLRRIIEDQLAQNKKEEEALPLQEKKEPPLHDLMEYEGFAKDVWKDIDVEQYLNEERNSWDG